MLRVLLSTAILSLTTFQPAYEAETPAVSSGDTTWVLVSAAASFVIVLLVSRVLPMRVSAENEREGLDLSCHGEHAWNLS